MPPHCDSMDGPVVKAAARALDQDNVDLILPYVPKESEEEVISAFERTQPARKLGADAKDVADRYFFETVVRVHRAGEGAPYTGLKPGGLGHGPVVPVAEQAIETGEVGPLLNVLTDAVRDQIQHKFDEVMDLKTHASEGVEPARKYVTAMLGLEVFSHKLHECAMTPLHEHHHG